jgi:hypothetical protein
MTLQPIQQKLLHNEAGQHHNVTWFWCVCCAQAGAPSLTLRPMCFVSLSNGTRSTARSVEMPLWSFASSTSVLDGVQDTRIMWSRMGRRRDQTLIMGLLSQAGKEASAWGAAPKNQLSYQTFVCALLFTPCTRTVCEAEKDWQQCLCCCAGWERAAETGMLLPWHSQVDAETHS